MNAFRHILIVFIGTFAFACLLSANSQFFLTGLQSPYFALPLLLVVILVGIIFDIIGVAVAAADETPLHARASRKQPGAVQALALVKNADKVANFCNDVVGDICGTLSGSLGAAIAILLPWGDTWAKLALMAGFVAALTVGGKAIGKTFAINESTNIIFSVGRMIAWLRYLLSFGRNKNTRGKKNLRGKNK